MTNEEINIAIAEFHGWKHILKDPVLFRGTPPWLDDCLHEIPSYITDLNAMHEAQKGLTDDEWETYADYLLFPNGDEAHSNYTSLRRGCMATAVQRAEAFLKTVGKWKE
jgi:hypothetical protein